MILAYIILFNFAIKYTLNYAKKIKISQKYYLNFIVKYEIFLNLY